MNSILRSIYPDTIVRDVVYARTPLFGELPKLREESRSPEVPEQPKPKPKSRYAREFEVTTTTPAPVVNRGSRSRYARIVGQPAGPVTFAPGTNPYEAFQKLAARVYREGDGPQRTIMSEDTFASLQRHVRSGTDVRGLAAWIPSSGDETFFGVNRSTGRTTIAGVPVHVDPNVPPNTMFVVGQRFGVTGAVDRQIEGIQASLERAFSAALYGDGTGFTEGFTEEEPVVQFFAEAPNTPRKTRYERDPLGGGSISGEIPEEPKRSGKSRYERLVMGEAALLLRFPAGFVPREVVYERLSHEEFYSKAGIRLEPGQLEGVRTAFDYRPPPESSRLFGFCGEPPVSARQVLVMPAGRRSGKSFIFAAAKAVYQALSVDIRGLQPREEILCSFIAPKQSKAIETLGFSLGLLERICPDAIVGKISADKLPDHFYVRSELYAPNGPFIRFQAFGADSAGVNARGRWHLNVVLEEAAFFYGSGYKYNARDLYDAIKPALWPKGGRLQIISSPWAREGLLWELTEENRNAPKSAIVLQGATDLLRSDPHTLKLMRDARREYEDRGELDLWEREWRAVFLSLGSIRLYDEDTISLCGAAIPGDKQPRDLLVAGVDLGLVNDHAALCIARIRREEIEREGPEGSTIREPALRYAVIHVDEVSPTPGQPLEPSKVCRRFADQMRTFGVRTAASDHHYHESLREALQGSGIHLLQAPDKATCHMRARTLMRERRIDLPNDPRLEHQLTLLKRRPLPAGKISVEAPHGSDGHCDMADAFAYAVFQAWGTRVPDPPPTPAQRVQREEDAYLARAAKRAKGGGRFR